VAVPWLAGRLIEPARTIRWARRKRLPRRGAARSEVPGRCATIRRRPTSCRPIISFLLRGSAERAAAAGLSPALGAPQGLSPRLLGHLGASWAGLLRLPASAGRGGPRRWPIWPRISSAVRVGAGSPLWTRHAACFGTCLAQQRQPSGRGGGRSPVACTDWAISVEADLRRLSRVRDQAGRGPAVLSSAPGFRRKAIDEDLRSPGGEAVVGGVLFPPLTTDGTSRASTWLWHGTPDSTSPGGR